MHPILDMRPALLALVLVFTPGPTMPAPTTGALPLSITLVSFDGTVGSTYSFSELNDPVMGGRSTGTFHVENGHGICTRDLFSAAFLVMHSCRHVYRHVYGQVHWNVCAHRHVRSAQARTL